MSFYNYESIDMWENRPAQLEEINQCIYNHRDHDDWFCFDTALLLEQQGEPDGSRTGVVSGEDDYSGIKESGDYYVIYGHYFTTLEEARQYKISVGYAKYQRWGTYDESNPANSKLAQNSMGWDLRHELRDVRYDFIVVNTENILVRNDDNSIDWSQSGIIYTFLIRNTLWDGTIQVYKSMSADLITDDVDYWMDGVNSVQVTVMGAQSRSIRVCFHMSQVGSGRQGSGMELLNTDFYEEQFDKSYTHKGFVYNTLDGKGMPDVKVTLEPCDKNGNVLDKGIPKTSTTTASKNDPYTYDGETLSKTVNGKKTVIIEKGTKTYGVFSIAYGAVDVPGVYYVLLTAKYTALGTTYTSSKVVQVNKVQERTRGIRWDSEYFAYKGSRKTFSVYVDVFNKYGQLEDDCGSIVKGHNVTVYNIKGGIQADSQQATVDSDGRITFKMDYRKYYENSSSILISLSPADGFTTISSEQKVSHSYYIAKTFDEIKSECVDVDGADYILVAEDVMDHTGTEPITINRDQTISGMKPHTTRTTSDGWATLDGNTKNIIKVLRGTGTEGVTTLTLNGLKFIHGKRAIVTQKYTALIVNQCYFTANENGNQANGVCITNDPYSTVNGEFINEIEKAKSAGDWYYTSINDSYFYNNKGNCIYSLGETYIMKNLFRTNDKDCLIQPEPKIVIVDAGTVEYNYNKSHIKVTERYDNSHSWAKATCFVNYNSTFNGRGPAELKDDDALPLFSFNSNYSNEAYTYAIYYYNPTRHNLVCYPSDGGKYSKGYYYGKRNRERSATGHGSAGSNPVVNQWMGKKPQATWVYYDGYLFNYWNNGKNLYNTNDPWTSEELAIPNEGGVYDPVKEKFDSGFTPKSVIKRADSDDTYYEG